MLIGLMLLATATSAPVQVGNFNPSAFPKAVLRERRMPVEDLTARADRIMSAKACSFPGQKVDSYAITVPYAVLLQPSGAISKVVVKDVGCPDLEILTGQVANELGKAGDFKQTGAPAEQWYIGEVFYGHGGEDLASTVTDRDQVICEPAKLATGSNIALRRVCRTPSQWGEYRTQRLQFHQDMISNAHAGCTTDC